MADFLCPGSLTGQPGLVVGPNAVLSDPASVGRWWVGEGVAWLRGAAELVTAVAMLLGAVAHWLTVLRKRKKERQVNPLAQIV